MKTARYSFRPVLLLMFLAQWMACQATDLSQLAESQTGPATRPQRIEDFDAGWLFSKSDDATAMMPEFDDHNWQPVNVPHDWSSDGPFSDQYASGTGYAPGGVGWYRKHFQLGTNQMGRVVTIEFDGVYDNSEVWINGHFAGRRPYGYSSFEYHLTRFLNFGPQANVIAVRVDHSRLADS